MEPWEIHWENTSTGHLYLYGSVTDTFRYSTDLPATIKKLQQMLDEAPHPISYLLDVRELQTNFTEVMLSLRDGSRGGTSWMKHENLQEVVFIGTSSLFNLAVNAIGQRQYSGRSGLAVAYESLEEGIAHIEQKAQSQNIDK